MNRDYKRHDLLYMDKKGREYAFLLACNTYSQINQDEIKLLILDSNVPAIVKRQEQHREDIIEVGFSSHRYLDGSRLRIGTAIPLKSVTKVITPYQIIDDLTQYHSTPKLEIIIKLMEYGKEYGISIGLFGSTALAILTSMSYCREDSDIDLCIKRMDHKSDLRLFYQCLMDLEVKYCTLIDAELQLELAKDTYGVKLKELFSKQKTVLAKGLKDAELFYKKDIHQWIGA